MESVNIMKKGIALLLGIGMSAALVFLPATDASAYTVESGDTMSEIAKEHSLDLVELTELNPQIDNVHLIYTGEYIETDFGKAPQRKVANVSEVEPAEEVNPQPQPQPIKPEPIPDPEPIKPTPPDCKYIEYTVQKGDTMYGIAQRFGIVLQELMKLNPHIIDSSKINPGDILYIPIENKENNEENNENEDESEGDNKQSIFKIILNFLVYLFKKLFK